MPEGLKVKGKAPAMMSARILIVDDEVAVLNTFGAFLVRDGYEVRTAADFDTALEIIRKENIDFILLDIMLGEHTGIELLREIKLMGLNTPVIMITGQPDIDNAASALRHGAFDYIVKPIRRETLLRVTKHALQHKALLDEKRILEQDKARYQAHLEAVFDSVDDAIITLDEDMNVIEANAASERICGLSPKSPAWKSPGNGCPMKCLEVLKDSLAKKSSVVEYTIECVNHKGATQVIVMSVSPLRIRGEEPSGAVMVLRDITRLTSLERELKERHGFHNIIGGSRRMREVYALLDDLREIDATVLITGPSGTGKELVARAIHYAGPRAGGPFVVVNCSALAENLLESELFGHVRGAFTGAIKDRKGRFELADKGTIFLDEIGDISPRIQLKLLRVLESKEIERVGEASPIPLDVQVITATNRDLRELVKQGGFREDLYYRLKVVEVRLPALAERSEDIPLLVEHYLGVLRERFHKDIRAVSPEVGRAFMDYEWPGNVRELIHCLEHAFVVCRTHTIGMSDLPPEIRGSGAPAMAEGKPSRLDRDTILQALDRYGGNKAKAARALGVSRQTIYRKIRELGLEDTVT